MWFWIIYILSCLCITIFFFSFLPSKWKLPFFILFTTLVITPTTIEVSSDNLAPAISIFLYDLIFEKNLSYKSLRVLLLSIPINLIILFVILRLKRKFF